MSQTHETDTCEVLVVRNLNVAFRQQDAPEVQAVRQLSFSLRRGETLAIVGESGSGKSVTALALMRLLDAASSEVNSEGLWLRRRNRQVIALNEQTDAEMRRVRGADLAMIFQEPMTSLNPVFTIGEQIAESLRLHQGLGREEALRAAKKMLDQVRIPQAEEMLSRYPHQLSGGMRQRVMIAMALSCRPAVLIADEPTTALDVTIQAQILQLIAVLQKEMAMGVIFITHDMGVVADIADRVLVMYRGEAVETGSVEEIFRSPQHPYTQSLLAAVPRLGEMRGQDLPRRFPLLAKNSKLELVASPSIMQRYISMNVTQKPFDNPKVREAINYAINRQALVKVAFAGYATPATGVVPPSIAYAQTYTAWPYDPAKARQLLKEAGYPNGFSTTLWSSHNHSTAQKVLQFTQQQLAQVGIKAQVTAMDAGQRAAEVEGKGQKESGVRMFYTGWSASTGEADWALSPLFASQNWPPTLFNTAFYSNPQVDNALSEALKTTDPQQKTKLYKEAQDIIWKESPWVPLVVEKLVSAHSKNLTGFYIQPDTGFSFEQADLTP